MSSSLLAHVLNFVILYEKNGSLTICESDTKILQDLNEKSIAEAVNLILLPFYEGEKDDPTEVLISNIDVNQCADYFSQKDIVYFLMQQNLFFAHLKETKYAIVFAIDYTRFYFPIGEEEYLYQWKRKDEENDPIIQTKDLLPIQIPKINSVEKQKKKQQIQPVEQPAEPVVSESKNVKNMLLTFGSIFVVILGCVLVTKNRN